jgi:polyribonucleotide nucleotidyltransferase
MKTCIKCGKNPKHSTLSICRSCRKEYNTLNKEQIKRYNKSRYEKDKPEILKKIRSYHSKHKTEIKEYQQLWFKENKDRINQFSRTKYNSNIEFKIKLLLRGTLLSKLKIKNASKYSSSLKLVGCTIEELRSYLEKQFLPEMTWENHGSIWEIDHILPCASFDLTKEEEQKKCFHYTNLQPLFKTTEIAESLGYKDYIGNRNKSKK